MAESIFEFGLSVPRTECQDYVGCTIEPQAKSPPTLPFWFNSLTCHLTVGSENLY